MAIEDCLFACKNGSYSIAGVEYATQYFSGVVLGTERRLHSISLLTSTQGTEVYLSTAAHETWHVAYTQMGFAADLENWTYMSPSILKALSHAVMNFLQPRHQQRALQRQLRLCAPFLSPSLRRQHASTSAEAGAQPHCRPSRTTPHIRQLPVTALHNLRLASSKPAFYTVSTALCILAGAVKLATIAPATVQEKAVLYPGASQNTYHPPPLVHRPQSSITCILVFRLPRAVRQLRHRHPHPHPVCPSLNDAEPLAIISIWLVWAPMRRSASVTLHWQLRTEQTAIITRARNVRTR